MVYFVIACVVFVTTFCAVAFASYKHTPAIGVGGLLLLLALGELVFH